MQINAFVNKIICGDCLQVMAEMPKGYIHLIYIDPPFGFDGDKVFGMPKWSTLNYPVNHVDDILPIVPRDIGMRNYLRWLFDRIQQAYRVLKDTGSIYLHCDPTASHYLKIFMDTILNNPACFRNELIWHYRRWPAKSKRFQRMHDVILFYTKEPGNENSFNTLMQTLSEGTLHRWKGYKSKVEHSEGIRLTTQMTTEKSTGTPLDDVWDIPLINSQAKERLGYPTQKPEALLDHIIKASSNEGDIVLDPFCGCGTTIAVAERLKRKWIGIDINPKACAIAEQRIAAGD